MNLPEELLHNPHFVRYYRTWEKNRTSIVFVALAQICREKGLLSEAKEICEKGLEAHPDSVGGRILLARILYDQDETDKARTVIEKVLRHYPAQREAQSLLARIARCCGQSKEDRMQGESSIPLWENVTMAKIYADQGEKAIALQIVLKCIERNPGDARALRLREELRR